MPVRVIVTFFSVPLLMSVLTFGVTFFSVLTFGVTFFSVLTFGVTFFSVPLLMSVLTFGVTFFSVAGVVGFVNFEDVEWGDTGCGGKGQREIVIASTVHDEHA
jgi:hypothetical protein